MNPDESIKPLLTQDEVRKIQTVLLEVAFERHRQQAKWGQQNHVNSLWLAILTEEVGEAATACLDVNFAQVPSTLAATRQALRNELIQISAVAVQWVEKLDRERFS